MPTPPKPYEVLKGEKKSHRTKEELEQRRRGEEALHTNVRMQEWASTKAAPIAHKTFLRLKKLLKNIKMDDALHESAINRYCVMTAESADLEADRERVVSRLKLIDEWVSRGEMSQEEHAAESLRLVDAKLSIERALATKRKMLLDIEKENVMTIAAGLRSVPKKPEEQEETAMDQLMRKRMSGRV